MLLETLDRLALRGWLPFRQLEDGSILCDLWRRGQVFLCRVDVQGRIWPWID